MPRTQSINKLIPFSIFTVLIFALPALSQELPKEIRGYKVHKTSISVKTSVNKAPARSGPEALVKLGDPAVTDFSFTGITFEIPAEVTAFDQSGRVDFLTFHDFKVDGLAVEVEEYRNPFSFRKNELVVLPKPARVFLGTGQIVKAAWKEIAETKKEWTITGRVFVFGKFKKLGFSFKRVIPVDIILTIKNPLIEYKSKISVNGNANIVPVPRRSTSFRKPVKRADGKFKRPLPRRARRGMLKTRANRTELDSFNRPLSQVLPTGYFHPVNLVHPV